MDGAAAINRFAQPASGAIDDGMSCRSAAARPGLARSAIRWLAQRRETGSFASKPQDGDMRSRRIEERRRRFLRCGRRTRTPRLKNFA